MIKCKERDVRIFDFIKSLFQSGYDEFKIIAIDFLNDIMLDFKGIISK